MSSNEDALGVILHHTLVSLRTTMRGTGGKTVGLVAGDEILVLRLGRCGGGDDAPLGVLGTGVSTNTKSSSSESEMLFCCG